MAVFFSNFKPFAAYWAAFMIYIFFPFFDFISLSGGWIIFCFILMCIFNLITGYIDGVAKIKWGILLFGLQLAAGAGAVIASASPNDNYILGYIATFGNLLAANFNYIFSNSKILYILIAILSVALPVAAFFAGWGIKKVVANKTAVP